MQTRRSDQTCAEFQRTHDRIFELDGYWYFQTREHDHGPFASRASAAGELERYVLDVQYCAAANCNPVYLLGAPRPKPLYPSELRRF